MKSKFKTISRNLTVNRKGTINYRVISLMIIFLITVEMPFNFLVSNVKAAEKKATVQANNTNNGQNNSSKLNTDSVQPNQASSLGFSTEQPERKDASGNIIDKKNNNPLGVKNLALSKILQLAVAGVEAKPNPSQANQVPICKVYNEPIGTTNISFDKGIYTPFAADADNSWLKVPKAMVSADINGNGKDSLVVAAIPSINSTSVQLKLLVSDNTSGRQIEKKYTVVNQMPKPLSNREDKGKYANYDYGIKIAAGDFNHDNKDEVAVTVGRSLYICKIDTNEAKVISTITYDENCSIAQVSNFQGGKPEQDDIPALDIETQDIDQDGFKELFVATGSTNGGRIYTPRLLIYNSTDTTKPCVNIELKVDNSKIFEAPSVTVGDVFGEGQKQIVIGGMIKESGKKLKYCLSTIKYNSNTKKYDNELDQTYDLISDKKIIQRIKNAVIGLKCVSLDTPKPGDVQYVVFGDFIFKYDVNEKKFVLVKVLNANNDSGLRGNSKESGAITNTNLEKDQAYILNTVVGNFDGNTSGKEQIIMLHYNSWYGGDYVYITWCAKGADGTISTHLKQIWKNEKKQAYNFPAICAPNILNKGVRLEFLPEKSIFTFSNPTVIAVLGASPYYKALKGEYGALGNVGTTYGTEKSTEHSTSNGVSAKVGISFGYKKELTLIKKIGEVSFETKIETSFTNTWTSAKSISKSISFTNGIGEEAIAHDSTVVMVVPYDIYYYNVYDDNNNVTEMVIQVPYEPMTKIMPINEYNSVAKGIKNAPIIGKEVLNHTVGDPRTYPQSSAGLSNIKDEDALTYGETDSKSFISCGTGSNFSQQGITTASAKGKSFDFNLDIEISFNLELFGKTGGISGGVGYNRNVTTTSTESTIRTGSVASISEKYSRYEFLWGLVAYNYNLKAGNSTQKCTVISYMVKPVGGKYPPVQSENLKVNDNDTTLKSIALQWDKDSYAAGYKISRANSENGIYTVIADLQGIDKTSFIDNKVEYNKDYYYKVEAYSNCNGIPTEPLRAQTLTLLSIGIKTSPKLFYNEGDKLDLSELVVTLNNSNNTTEDVSFKDFSKNDIMVSLANETYLDADNTGTPITITYIPSKKSIETSSLVVGTEVSNDLSFDVSFKVGNYNNATVLLPNEILTANITMKNNLTANKEVLVIIALYDNQGNMVKMSSMTRNILAGATENIYGGFKLPSNVDNYTAKVFVWDGTDISSTSQTPESSIVQIPK